MDLATVKSKFLAIDWKDVRRGVALGLAAACIQAGEYLFGIMQGGTVPTATILKSTSMVFLGTCGAYLLKNYFTNSADEFGKKEK